MRRSALPFGLLVLGYCSPAVAEGSQDDVVNVEELVRTARRHAALEAWRPPPEELVEAFQRVLLRRCEEQLHDLGIDGSAGAQVDDLRLRAHRSVSAALRGAWSKSPREPALLGLVRRTTSERRAADLVSAWLGFGPVGALLEDEKAGPALRARPPRFGAQASAGPAATDGVALAIDESELLQDAGGAGTGNSVLDAGEWIQPRLVVVNHDSLPHFSSSAWIRSEDGCSWTDASEEHELAEMNENGGKATFTPWVYLSRSCATPGERSLTVLVQDTRRSPVEAVRLPLRLRAYPLGPVGLTGVLFDTDVPGSSRGDGTTALRPGLRFELSSQIVFGTASVKAVRAAYGLAPDVARAFASFEKRPVRMLPTAPRQFDPGDDVDGLTLEEAAFVRQLGRLDRSTLWLRPQGGGKAWVAVDLELEAEVMADASEGGQRRGDAAASQRRTSGAGTRGEPTQRPEARAGAAPEASQVIDLVGRHVRLVPRPARTTVEGALDATEGYEVVFDREGFRADYAKLVGASQVLEPQEPRPPARLVATGTYVLRRFIALSVAPWTTRPQRPEEPTARAAPAARRELAVEPDLEGMPEPPRRFVGLAFGLAVGSHDLLQPEREGPTLSLWKDDQCLIVSPLGRITVGGERLRAAFSLTMGWGTADSTAGEATVTAFGVRGGVAYVLARGTVEVEPRVLLGVGFRDLTWDGPDTEAVPVLALEVGATVRLMHESGVGPFLDVAYVVSPDGPAIDDEPVVGGDGPRASLGLAVEF